MMEQRQQTELLNMHRSASPSNPGLLIVSDSDGDDSDCCMIGMYSGLDSNNPAWFSNSNDPKEPVRAAMSDCNGLNNQANNNENEMFEENNNDPNNNLEDIQFTEEVAHNEVDLREQALEMSLMNYRTKMTSPQPGCSRDFTEATKVPYDIQNEAIQLHKLIPKFGYPLIYNSLCQNRHAVNRIELTLWDLLPTKRPEPQVGCKRKFDETYTVNSKNMSLDTNQFQVHQNNLQQVLAPNKLQLPQITCTNQFKVCQNNLQQVLCHNQYLKLKKHKMSVVQNKLQLAEKTCTMWNATGNRKVILQEPKLTFDIIPSSRIMSTRIKRPILSPPKFTYSRSGKEDDTSPKKLKSYSNKDRKDHTNADNVHCINAPCVLSNVTDVKQFEITDKDDYIVQSFITNNNSDIEDNVEAVKATPCLSENVPASINDADQLIKEENKSYFKYDSNDSSDGIDAALINMDKINYVSEEEEKIEHFSDNKLTNSTVSNSFEQLTSLFPHVDPDYIQTICKDPPEEASAEKHKHADQYEVLYALIEHLLSHGKDHPMKPKVEPKIEEVNTDVNEQYTNLLGIFPDADPSYLREVAERVHNQPSLIIEFVQSKLETHDYPTREQFIAKRKITEQQMQYTTDFNMEQFLQIFPDPIKYFKDPNRHITFKPVAFEFLKQWFCKHKVCTVMSVYARCNYHLTLTAEYLKSIPPDMKTKRFTPLLPTEDIPLLQEIAFIRHESEIIKYLCDTKKKEATEFQNLKEKGKLWKCECCYEEECMPSKCSSCQNGHVFCNSCIRRGTESRIADGETRVPCFVNCGSEFSLSILQRVLSPTQFSILLQKRQEAEVMAAGLEGLVFCPFCHFASIPPPEDKVFKCFNPECMKESCRLCKKLNHVPLKCDEAAGENARHYLEEKMTAALVRTCYRCKRPFFKEEGCNKMRCVCGAEMCYICDKPINSYRHFSEGAAKSKLCPLWSDNNMINAQAVVRVAEAVGKEIQQQNPKIKLNTAALLPRLPAPKSNKP